MIYLRIIAKARTKSEAEEVIDQVKQKLSSIVGSVSVHSCKPYDKPREYEIELTIKQKSKKLTESGKKEIMQTFSKELSKYEVFRNQKDEIEDASIDNRTAGKLTPESVEFVWVVFR